MLDLGGHPKAPIRWHHVGHWVAWRFHRRGRCGDWYCWGHAKQYPLCGNRDCHADPRGEQWSKVQVDKPDHHGADEARVLARSPLPPPLNHPQEPDHGPSGLNLFPTPVPDRLHRVVLHALPLDRRIIALGVGPLQEGGSHPGKRLANHSPSSPLSNSRLLLPTLT